MPFLLMPFREITSKSCIRLHGRGGHCLIQPLGGSIDSRTVWARTGAANELSTALQIPRACNFLEVAVFLQLPVCKLL